MFEIHAFQKLYSGGPWPICVSLVLDLKKFENQWYSRQKRQFNWTLIDTQKYVVCVDMYSFTTNHVLSDIRLLPVVRTDDLNLDVVGDKTL